jgi:hypothetical protein
LLFLISLRPIKKGANKVQIQVDELAELSNGIERFVTREQRLSNITKVVQWAGILNNDTAYDLKLREPISTLKSKLRILLSQISFFEAHAHEQVEYWIELFTRWTLITGTTHMEYLNALEEGSRNYTSYDYWGLLFLIEGIVPGYIAQNVEPEILIEFTRSLSNAVQGLRLGLNLREGKPKTEQEWFPLFREVDNLVVRMKKTATGLKIIDNHFRNDWDQVKKYSQFAKNRHIGMVSIKQWKPPRRLKDLRLIKRN